MIITAFKIDTEEFKLDESVGSKIVGSAGTLFDIAGTLLDCWDYSDSLLPSELNTTGFIVADGVNDYTTSAHTELWAEGAIVRQDPANPTKAFAYDSAGVQISLVYTPTANETNRASNLKQIHDTNSDIPKRWAHLDGLIKADGLYKLMPDPNSTGTYQEQVGWWNKTRCNAAAEWWVNPELIITFDARPVLSLFVSGDTYLNEYPIDFTIDIYAGVTLQHTETVTGNTLVKWSKNVSSLSLASITKMILTISKWSTANRIVKISEFYTAFYQTFEGDEIVSMNLLEERVIGDGSLPVGNISSNELDLTLNNVAITAAGSEIIDPFFPGNAASIFYELIRKNRRVEPYLGFLLPSGLWEYVKLGVFWTGDWSVNEQDYTASVSCRDRMELLRKAEYDAYTLFENETLYDIMQFVLDYARTNIPMSSLEWRIDEELKDYTIPYAWFPKQDYFKTIKQIVEACMGQAYMNKSDVLIIEGPSALISAAASVLTIDRDDYFTREQPEKSEEQVNRVEVTTQPLLPDAAPSQVFSTSKPITLEPSTFYTLTAEYGSPPVLTTGATATITAEEGSIATLTILSSTFYPWGAVIIIENNDPDYAGSASITIDGIALKVQGKETIVSEDADSIADNGLQKYSYPNNHLIQSPEIALQIATALLNSYKQYRKDVNVNWRGNPALELADDILVTTYERGATKVQESFRVYKNQITFDGSLNQTTDGRKI